MNEWTSLDEILCFIEDLTTLADRCKKSGYPKCVALVNRKIERTFTEAERWEVEHEHS